MTKLLKITKTMQDIYIPSEFIASFSFTGTSITINFTKELKITGFKKADKIVISQNYYSITDLEDIKKQILNFYN